MHRSDDGTSSQRRRADAHDRVGSPAARSADRRVRPCCSNAILGQMSAPPGQAATRRAIITGGSSGIGRATVLELARRGYDVGFTFRTREAEAAATADVVRSLGRRAETRRLDLERADDGIPAVEDLARALGGVDVLVNNAATNPRRSLLQQSLDDWRVALEVDLTGPLACGQAAARAMVERGAGGRIVNVTSVLQEVPLPGGGAYCAAKAALGMLTRVMALELAEHGITVNAVAPGHTATPMNYAGMHVDAATTHWPQIPIKRSAEPAEVAAVIAFLASEEASYTTGGSYLVDGGLLLVSGPGVLQDATGLPPSSG